MPYLRRDEHRRSTVDPWDSFPALRLSSARKSAIHMQVACGAAADCRLPPSRTRDCHFLSAVPLCDAPSGKEIRVLLSCCHTLYRYASSTRGRAPGRQGRGYRRHSPGGGACHHGRLQDIPRGEPTNILFPHVEISLRSYLESSAATNWIALARSLPLVPPALTSKSFDSGQGTWRSNTHMFLHTSPFCPHYLNYVV